MQNNKIMRNKKAWIRIVEVFVAILFLIGVIIIALNAEEVKTDEKGSEIEKFQFSVLKEIQVNESLREDVLSASVPLNWSEAGFPLSIKNKINSRALNYLNCTARICEISSECKISDDKTSYIYANNVFITVNKDSTNYDPRQLKIFCWEK